MNGLYQRTELLVGPDVMQRIRDTRVILFGVGGVGGWCAEALVRSGVGHLTLVDADVATGDDSDPRPAESRSHAGTSARHQPVCGH